MQLPFHACLRICLLCIALLATGCISNKTFLQKRVFKKNGTFTVGGTYQAGGVKPPLILKAEQITNAVVATETNGATLVSYASDLQPQAAFLAPLIEQAFAHSEALLGMNLLMRPHIYLLRIPNEQRVIEFSLSVPATNKNLPWLLVLTNVPPEINGSVAPAPKALWTDFRHLPVQLFIMAHESCETHLIDPREFLVMGDIEAKHGFVHFTLKYHTRWFRDGLANYAGYKVTEFLRHQLPQDEQIEPDPLGGQRQPPMRFVQDSMQPFSDLAKIKDKVFDWNQNSKADNYDAATGLFLLIEERKGPEAIAAILRKLPELKLPDGKALLALVQEQTGLKLLSLARNFTFPDLGFTTDSKALRPLELKAIAPGSWADQANLHSGDVLLAANAIPIAGRTDLELQLLNALDQHQALSLTYLRNGQRCSTESLPLEPR
jgi:hypothetical protein